MRYDVPAPVNEINVDPGNVHAASSGPCRRRLLLASQQPNGAVALGIKLLKLNLARVLNHLLYEVSDGVAVKKQLGVNSIANHLEPPLCRRLFKRPENHSDLDIAAHAAVTSPIDLLAMPE